MHHTGDRFCYHGTISGWSGSCCHAFKQSPGSRHPMACMFEDSSIQSKLIGFKKTRKQQPSKAVNLLMHH